MSTVTLSIIFFAMMSKNVIDPVHLDKMEFGQRFHCSLCNMDHESRQNMTGCGSSLGSMSVSQAAVPQLIILSRTFFVENYFPSSTDTRRASFQILAKEFALNTGKLPLRGLPRNSVVK